MEQVLYVARSAEHARQLSRNLGVSPSTRFAPSRGLRVTCPGGNMTGMRFDRVIVAYELLRQFQADEETMTSKELRDQEWWRTSVLTRLSPGGSVAAL